MNGVGVSEHHHGEILQGVVRRGAEWVPCLITMPTRRLGSRARYVPMAGESDGDFRDEGARTAVAGGLGVLWRPAPSADGAGSGQSAARPAVGGVAAVGGGSGAALRPAPSAGGPDGGQGGWAALDTRGTVAGQGDESVSAPKGRVLEVVPAWKSKAACAARLALEFVGAPVGGRLEIECSVATGVGLGSSTCDVVAAIRAVCAAYGVAVEPDVVARIAVAAEGAADPIMFDREVVLFAQRQGRVLEAFGSWIPPYVVVSVDTDVGTAGVDTLSLPLPQYTVAELDAFEVLVARARAAFERRDAAAIAVVATESATMNQRFVSLRGFREIVALADEFGALGVQIAHSGTVAGILFDAGTARARRTHGPARRTYGPADRELTSEVMARLRTLGARPLGVFETGADTD